MGVRKDQILQALNAAMQNSTVSTTKPSIAGSKVEAIMKQQFGDIFKSENAEESLGRLFQAIFEIVAEGIEQDEINNPPA